MIYNCCNQNRKNSVLNSTVAINGIDYLEVMDSDATMHHLLPQQILLVHCLKPLTATPTAANVLITGGESITKVTAVWVALATTPPATMTGPQQAYFTMLPDAANVVMVGTSVAGDFSPYKLRLVDDITQAEKAPFELMDVLAGFDSQLAEVEFSFKVECPPNFDCAPQTPDCPPALPAPPPINYLAKDYGSFRSIMLDRLSQLLPGWTASSEVDMGIALTELIAYVADRFSYQQDAIATEAYLETARSRVSLRRHAVLVDYHVHDGCNARAWIQIQVSGNPGDQIFLDRSNKFYTYAPGMPLSLSGNETAAILSGVQVFEPMWDQVLYPDHNQMFFYTWGDENCCLPQGATEATLRTSLAHLQIGDVLIFQEIIGPQTGDKADADIRHRCAVRLTQVTTEDSTRNPLVDPLSKDNSGNPIQVTEIQWSQEDALPFPVCISSTVLDDNGDPKPLPDVSVAFGNVVLADHGLIFPPQPLVTVPQRWLKLAPKLSTDRCQVASPPMAAVRYRPRIPDSPLTQAVPLTTTAIANIGAPQTTSIVPLGTDPISLTNSQHFNCLTLQITNPAGWPQYFGVVASVNSGTPANFDLSVVYNPPGSAKPVTVEVMPNLSFDSGNPQYAVTQINGTSKLVQAPSAPTKTVAGFRTVPTMLSNTAPTDVQDLNGMTFLTLQSTDTKNWPALFGVQALPGGGSLFNLEVDYDPPSGVAVPQLEEFDDLSLSAAAAEVNGKSALITIDSVASTAGAGLSAHELANYDPNLAVPAISLSGISNESTETWNPMQDLLENGESDAVFVVEVESDSTATLRFGDNVNGKTPASGTEFNAGYRIGNGSAGNVGANSLTYHSPNPQILQCTNPLPASGGADPETNDQIRRRAPQAFLTQERAVTMADYAAVTEQNPGVGRAVASLRWTGSWYTVFIAVEPQGGGNLTATQQKTLKNNLNLYHLAGQDLELDSPQYVPLQIGLEICVDPSYFQSEVQRALMQVLGSGISSNGQKGLFYPDNFTFGQSVYLSPIFAAARSVAGVVSVRATTFQLQGVNSTQYLSAGEIKMGPLQVAQLANDSSFPNHGQLTLVLEGGK